MAKWKEHGKELMLNDCIETRDPKTLRAVWHVKVGLPHRDLLGKASHQQKASARYLATQRFLKLVMPNGYTWNDTVKLFMDKNSVE